MFWRQKTYDELPALAIRGSKLREMLRVVTIAWMYGIVWMTFVSGSHVKIFANMLGFTDFTFGLLTAVGYLATIGQLFAAVIIETTGLKKYQFVYFGTAHRLLWLLIAMIPLVLPTPSSLAVGAMLVVMGSSSLFAALSSPACMTWLGDIIPRRIRGRYFANRFLYSRPVQIAVVILLGVLLNIYHDRNLPETAAAQPMLLYIICGIFAVAALFGAADILLFRKVPESLRCVPDAPAKPLFVFDAAPPTWWNPLSVVRYSGKLVCAMVPQLLIDPLRDRVFRDYVLYGSTLTFAMGVPGWFFWKNATENLGFGPLGANLLFLVISPVLGLLGAKKWGSAIDRWGRKPVLMIASIGTWLSVMPWFFAARDTPHPAIAERWLNAASAWAGGLFGHEGYTLVTPDFPLGAYMVAIFASIFGGVAWTGVQLAQQNVILGFSDGQGRSKYIAATSVLTSIGGVLGGVVGGLVAGGLEGLLKSHGLTAIQVGPFRWNQWHATFAISWVTRMAAILWLIHMPEPNAASTRSIVKYLTANVYNTVAAWLFYPLRVFGWGRGVEDSPDRRRQD